MKPSKQNDEQAMAIAWKGMSLEQRMDHLDEVFSNAKFEREARSGMNQMAIKREREQAAEAKKRDAELSKRERLLETRARLLEQREKYGTLTLLHEAQAKILPVAFSFTINDTTWGPARSQQIADLRVAQGLSAAPTNSERAGWQR